MTACRTALICAVVLAQMVTLPALASAGTYDVMVCDAAEGIGGGNHALALTANNSFESQVHCPTDNSYPDGIVAWNKQQPGKALWLRGAGGTFNAPPGTTVREIFWRGAMSRADCHWGLGIAANNQLLYGLPANSSCAKVGLDGEQTVAVNAPVFWAGVACGNLDGCPTAHTSAGWRGYQAAMRTHYLRVRVDDTTAPSVLNLSGPLASGAWVRGTQNVTFDASDGAGILLSRLRVATSERDSALRFCDYRRPAPCTDISGGAYSFNTAGLQDGQHQVAVEAIDPGGNVGSATATLRSDNTPPARPIGLAVDGGEGWRGTNAFDLSWQNPQDPHAPVVAAHHSVCPAGQLDGCTTGSARGEQIRRLTAVTVPGPGDWTLRAWLEDAAGNADDKTASDPVHLRFDDRAPQVAFSPQDPDDPRRVSATVTDPASGPASGAIEISRQGSGSWRALLTTLESATLVAYVDDERLRDGRYLLRAQAADAAGNQGIGDQRLDGSPAELELPLRVATRLRVGVPERVTVHTKKRGKKRRRHVTRLIARKRVPYGRNVGVEGRLRNRDGQPIAGQNLTVYARTELPDARFQPLGSVTTNDRGRFRYRARALYSVRLRIHYRGTALIRPTSDDSVLLVPGRVSLRPSRKRALNGQRVVFRGRFRAPENLDAGKLVELQAQVGRKWRTFVTARTGDDGRYVARYRFKSTTGRVTYRFRARLPKERAFPYDSGRSRMTAVVVRGP